MHKTCRFLIVVILMGAASNVAADQWERFRGPNGSGIANAKNFPTKWNDEHIRWKTELPGVGNSSPVIWDDKVFTLCSTSDGESVTIVSTDLKSGEINWKREYESSGYRVHTRSSFSSSTPAVDKDRVYFTFASPAKISLVALTHDGKDVWEKDLGTWLSQHGYGASPMVYKDKVIFVNSQQAQQVRRGQTPGQSHVIAFDSATGNEVWKTELAATRACYSMPCVVKDAADNDMLVNVNTGNGFYAINPVDGKMMWEIPAFTQRVVASTVVSDGRVYGSCGSGGGGNYLTAIHLGKHPDKAFSVRKAACYVPTVLAFEKRLYLFNDRGVVNCVNAESGEEVWTQRISSAFSGSPVCVNGIVYCIDEAGAVHSFKAADKYEMVDRYNLGEKSQSTPAVAQDVMILRTDSRLICIGAE